MATPYPITKFGGLRLDLEPDEVGANEAIDLLNVDFDKPGAVRVRDGVSKFNAVAGAATFTGLFAWDVASPFVIANDTGGVLRAYNSAGVLAASSAATGSTLIQSAASLGTGSAGPYLYFGLGVAANRRFDGTTFTAPASQPTCSFVAVNDNRLVAASVGALPSGSGAAAASTSLVHFSDRGAPETWSANNYVYLSPNDGESITAAISWRDSLFVFKQSRFFVFYGNSTDATGEPVFNYRTIDTGIGAHSGAALGANACCATADGVYFVNKRGVYRTTGGPPQKISGPLDPLFAKIGSQFFQSSDLLSGVPAALGIAAFQDRVLVSVTLASAGVVTFVYYPEAGTWSTWQPARRMYAIGGFITTTSRSYLVWTTGTNGGTSGDARIYFLDPTATSDDGTAIVSRYRSGFYNPSGSPDRECTARESVIDGIGTPTFSVSRDFAATLPTTGGGAKGTVTLGTSPAYAQGRHRTAQRGRRFSYQIEATSGAWRVDSITQQITAVRSAGLKTT